MGFVVWGWSQGRFSVGDVVVVNTLLAQLFRPLDLLGMVYRTIRQGLIDMDAMFALIDTPAEVVDMPGAPDLDVAAGLVRFENVHFGYDPGREILKGVDLEVRPGSTTAIVGPSGAGKSTLSRLLFRFYEPQSGRITIDGQDIAQGHPGEPARGARHRSAGHRPVQRHDRLQYRLRQGRRDARPRSRARPGARRSTISSPSLPDGYEAMVGERGLKLSGGEKQRVAIARTLLKDPPILILDEATSALDSRTEAAIQETLQRRHPAPHLASSSPTACRPWSTPTRSSCSTQGRVAERGTHAQLLRANGLYADMWARQQSEREEEEGRSRGVSRAGRRRDRTMSPDE